MTSEIRANTIKNRVGLGTVSFTNTGTIVSGIVTATGADINGDLDVDGHTNLDNISIAGVTTTSGLLDINAGGRANTFKVEDLTDNRIVIAGTGGELEDSANLTFNGSTLAVTGSQTVSGDIDVVGNVSIGGTLTYQDVTNVDSVGIITARSGVDFSSLLREGVNITAGKLSDNTNIDLSNGMVHLFTTTETTTSTPNIRIDGSNSLNSKMGIGEAITVVIIVTAAAAGYSAQLTIDGSAVTEEWLGGSAPSAGGAGGFDVYNHNIIKTADATYLVLSNLVNYTN